MKANDRKEDDWVCHISGRTRCGAVYVGDRLVFLSKATRVAGEVTQVSAKNGSCKRGGRNRSRYRCTIYSAIISYTTTEDGNSYNLKVSAGDTPNHNVSKSGADHWVRESVAIVYDPANPQKRYRDRFWDLWGKAMFAVFVVVFGVFMTLGDSNKGPKTTSRRGKAGGANSSSTVDKPRVSQAVSSVRPVHQQRQTLGAG